jgi:hypothetical protein
MWPFKKKSRREMLSEEILRFKKRVEKRWDGRSPFVEPFCSWEKLEEDGTEWNSIKIMLFFTTDDSDSVCRIKVSIGV